LGSALRSPTFCCGPQVLSRAAYFARDDTAPRRSDETIARGRSSGARSPGNARTISTRPRSLGEGRAAIGFSTNVVYLALLYVSLRHLSAGMSAIIASTNPLVLALLAPILLHESLGWRKLAGLLIGFGGVVF